jgi:hypothetical protein
MNSALKWTLIVLVGAILIGLAVWPVMKAQTKKHSPEQDVMFKQGDLLIEIRYSSPSKKGREIFGGLVPYDQIWRTGANEASVFISNKPLQFEEGELPAGTYSLFSIPGEDRWQIIFNKKEYDWGINFDQTSPREEEHDALICTGISTTTDTPQEAFTMSVDFSNGSEFILAWDRTRVSVPFTH